MKRAYFSKAPSAGLFKRLREVLSPRPKWDVVAIENDRQVVHIIRSNVDRERATKIVRNGSLYGGFVDAFYAVVPSGAFQEGDRWKQPTDALIVRGQTVTSRTSHTVA